MEETAETLWLTLITASALFFMPLLGTLFGAFGGWVVGLFFDDTIRDTLARFNVQTDELHIWQLGAVFGFMGGYFRTTVKSSSD